jgi:hypothetical protein
MCSEPFLKGTKFLYCLFTKHTFSTEYTTILCFFMFHKQTEKTFFYHLESLVLLKISIQNIHLITAKYIVKKNPMIYKHTLFLIFFQIYTPSKDLLEKQTLRRIFKTKDVLPSEISNLMSTDKEV